MVSNSQTPWCKSYTLSGGCYAWGSITFLTGPRCMKERTFCLCPDFTSRKQMWPMEDLSIGPMLWHHIFYMYGRSIENRGKCGKSWRRGKKLLKRFFFSIPLNFSLEQFRRQNIFSPGWFKDLKRKTKQIKRWWLSSKGREKQIVSPFYTLFNIIITE